LALKDAQAREADTTKKANVESAIPDAIDAYKKALAMTMPTSVVVTPAPVDQYPVQPAQTSPVQPAVQPAQAVQSTARQISPEQMIRLLSIKAGALEPMDRLLMGMNSSSANGWGGW